MIITLGLLQLTLINNFRVLGVKPDLILLSVIVASFFFELKWVLVFALFAGIFKDTFCTSLQGVNTLLFPVFGFIIVEFLRRVTMDDIYLKSCLAFVVIFLYNLILGLALIYSGQALSLGISLRVLVLESLYSSIVLLLIFKILTPIYYNVR